MYQQYVFDHVHWQFVQSKPLYEINQGLDELDRKGYHFQSIALFEQRYPGTPIQLCQLHQSHIIRRYTTSNPKSNCGKALRLLMEMED